MNGFFITGTDTGIGKTRAACALLHAIRALGFDAVGMKPVASGCTHTPQGWRNDDALALQACSDPTPAYSLVNPYALPEATAPEIASKLADIMIEFNLIQSAFAKLRQSANVVVVEGVGGWLAPLNSKLEQFQIPIRLDLQPILVVGLKLGCIHHARATLAAMRQIDMAPIAWICSRVDGELAHADEYFRCLKDAMNGTPLLGDLPFNPLADSAENARKLDDAILLQALVSN